MNLPTYKGKQLIPFTPLRQSLIGLPIIPGENGSANIEGADGRYPKGHIEGENTAVRHIEKRSSVNGTKVVNGSGNKLKIHSSMSRKPV